MDLNPLDRITLKAAMEKLTASASALEEARKDINSLLLRLDAAPAGQAASLESAEEAEVAEHSLTAAGSVGHLRELEPQELAQLPRNAPHFTPVPTHAGWSYPPATPPAPTAPSIYPPPSPPARPSKPRLTSEEKIMRAVAIGGGIITVAGIILLVSLAIQRGWLGPLGRVIGAYLLALALVAAASWVRKKEGRTAAIVALTVTSQLAFIATTLALVFVLYWVPENLGSLIVLLGNAAYLILGRIWSHTSKHQHQTSPQESPHTGSVFLASTIVTGFCALYFVPMNTAWWPLFGISVALIASWRISTTKSRIAAAIFAVGIPFLLTTAWAIELWPAVISGVLNALLLVALTLWDPPAMDPTRQDAAAQTRYWRNIQADSSSIIAGVFAPIPITLFTAWLLADNEHPWLAMLPAVMVAALSLYGALQGASTSNALYKGGTARIAQLCAAMGLCLVAANFVVVFGASTPYRTALTVVFLVVGTALLLVLRRTPTTLDMGIIPWVTWLFAAVFMTGLLLQHVVRLSPLWLTDLSALIQALLILAFIVAVVTGRRVFYAQSWWLQVLVGAIVLTLSATAIVTIVTFMGKLVGGNSGMLLGFVIGHAVVSILWMVIAACVLLSRRLFNVTGALWFGVALALAGTIKLVFFDLVALSGVPRAIAFLLSGIALLSIAALRGRRNKPALLDEPPAPTAAL